MFHKHQKNNTTPLNIVIVGAGGLGCQIVKHLFKTNHKITIIDYDTIAQTNLNRQFCFSSSDVGMSKVDALVQYFRCINKNSLIKVYNANIYQFHSFFFSKFDVIISAVDNNEARWYLNQIVIDRNIPLIDAGTAGFNGQTQIYERYVSECRMCRPQNIEHSADAAACTLRGKPLKNIHCVQFGVTMFDELRLVKEQKLSQSIFMKYLQKINIENQNQLQQACISIHNYLFFSKIVNIQNDVVVSVKYDSKSSLISLCEILQIDEMINEKKFNKILSDKIGKLQQNEQFLSQKQMKVQIYSGLFVLSLKALLLQQNINKYDKDQFLHCLFVFSVTNLRINAFKNTKNSKLSFMSYYQCKDLSGKIIPSINSTNSIAAALQVIMMNNFASLKNKTRYQSIKGYHSEYKIEKYSSFQPKIGCMFCSDLYNYVQIQANIDTTTWNLLEKFLIQTINDSFQYRDIRCNEFIIIKNSQNKLSKNNNAILSSNEKLITKCKTGCRIITIKYISNDKWKDNWKIAVVDVPGVEKPSILYGQLKQYYKDRIVKYVQKMKSNVLHEYNYQNNISNDILVVQQ